MKLQSLAIVCGLGLAVVAQAQVTGGGAAGAGAGTAGTAAGAANTGSSNLGGTRAPIGTLTTPPAGATGATGGVNLFTSPTQANNLFNQLPAQSSINTTRTGFAGQPGQPNPFPIPPAAPNPPTTPNSLITPFAAPARAFDFRTNETDLNPWLAGGSSFFAPGAQR